MTITIQHLKPRDYDLLTIATDGDICAISFCPPSEPPHKYSYPRIRNSGVAVWQGDQLIATFYGITATEAIEIVHSYPEGTINIRPPGKRYDPVNSTWVSPPQIKE